MGIIRRIKSCDCYIYNSPNLSNVNEYINLHSIAKIFQVLPIYTCNIAVKYDLTAEERVMLCSSHIGQTQHYEVLCSILRKTKIHLDDIIIKAQAPEGCIAFNNWKRSGLCESKLFNPCTGNHISMMLVQKELTGSVEGYLKMNAPSQKVCRQVTSAICQVDENSISIVRDNCGMPTYLMPYSVLAKGFANLANPPEYLPLRIREAIRMLKRDIRDNPLMIEGDGCIATILNSFDGIIAKTGVGGTLSVGIHTANYCEKAIVIHSINGTWRDVLDCLEYILTEIGYKNVNLNSAIAEVKQYV